MAAIMLWSAKAVLDWIDADARARSRTVVVMKAVNCVDLGAHPQAWGGSARFAWGADHLRGEHYVQYCISPLL